MFGKIKVDTDKLAQATALLNSASADYEEIAQASCALAARVALLGALDTSGAGADAAASLGQSAATLAAEKALIQGGAWALHYVRERYEAAEQAAAGLFSIYLGQQVDTSAVPMLADTGLYLGATVFKHNLAQFSYFQGGLILSLGKYARQAPDRRLQALSWLSYPAAIALFGQGLFLDATLNGKAFATRRLIDNMETLFGFSVQEASAYLSGLSHRAGAHRSLDHTKIVNQDATRAGNLLTAIDQDAVLARNLLTVAQDGEHFDALMLGQGQAQLYGTIAVQKIRDTATGELKAIVYLPGTDIDADLWAGDILGYDINLQHLQADTATSYQKAYAITQLVDQALSQAGIPPGTALQVVGHSQGAMAAFNMGSSPYLRGKYPVQRVLAFGGPTGNQQRVADVQYTEYRSMQDPLVELPGHQGEQGHQSKNSVIYLKGSGNTLDLFESHRMQSYLEALQGGQAAVYSGTYAPRNSFLQGRPTAAGTLTLAGSTFPEHSTAADIRRHRNVTLARGLTELAKDATTALAEHSLESLAESGHDQLHHKMQGKNSSPETDTQFAADTAQELLPAFKLWTADPASLETAHEATQKALDPSSFSQASHRFGSEAHAYARALPQDREPVPWVQEFNLGGLCCSNKRYEFGATAATVGAAISCSSASEPRKT